MKILFRLDAGRASGFGHLSRCVALADRFEEKGCSSFFLIRTDDTKAVDIFLKAKEISLSYSFLPSNTDQIADVEHVIEKYAEGYSFLVIDHYQHDLKYQQSLRAAGIRWAQFDYKVAEKIIANMVINANPSVSPGDYGVLVEGYTALGVGEEFSIIRKEFLKVRPSPQEGRVLIALGGGRYSENVLELIRAVTDNLVFQFDVVSQDKRLASLLAEKENVRTHIGGGEVAGVYAACEAAIAAGGVTTHELAYLKVPMFIVPYVQNQIPNAMAWEKKGFGVGFKGTADFLRALEVQGLARMIEELARKSSIRSFNVDGLGAERIAQMILGEI